MVLHYYTNVLSKSYYNFITRAWYRSAFYSPLVPTVCGRLSAAGLVPVLHHSLAASAPFSFL
jgi:hypothetical protein